MNNKISEIKIVPVQSDNGLVGFASFVLYDELFLGSIGIFIRPLGGYRLTYPLRKNTRDEINYFYPISKNLGIEIEEAITKKLLEESNERI